MAAVRAALEQRLKSLELELHQVERLQRKFAMIHSTLAQQQGGGHGKGEPDTPKLRQSEENPLNLSRSSLPPGGTKVGGVQLQPRPSAGAVAGLGVPASRQPACEHPVLPPLPPPRRRRRRTWARRAPSWPAWTWAARAASRWPLCGDARRTRCPAGACGGPDPDVPIVPIVSRDPD